jgi:hypothetical protein
VGEAEAEFVVETDGCWELARCLIKAIMFQFGRIPLYFYFIFFVGIVLCNYLSIPDKTTIFV